jgi:hypothetical protein
MATLSDLEKVIASMDAAQLTKWLTTSQSSAAISEQETLIAKMLDARDEANRVANAAIATEQQKLAQMQADLKRASG